MSSPDTDFVWYQRVQSWLNSQIRRTDFTLRILVSAGGHPASDTTVRLDDLTNVVNEWLDGIDVVRGEAEPMPSWQREWKDGSIRVVMRALLRDGSPSAAAQPLVPEPSPPISFHG